MSEKITLKKAISSHMRLYKLLYATNQNLVLSPLFKAILEGLSPYVTIYFSARLVSELSTTRSPTALLIDVLLVLFSTALFMLVTALVRRGYNIAWVEEELFGEKLLMDKYLSMDFVDADSQRTFDLRARVFQSRNYSGKGLPDAMNKLESLPKALIQIVAGLGLSITLFTSKVPSGPLTVLNSPFFALLILGLMLGITVLSSFFSNKSSQWMVAREHMGRFGNRVFSFYGWEMLDNKRSLDQRIYEQNQHISEHMMVLDNTFHPGGVFAQGARGIRGILSALSRCVSALLTGCIYLFVCLKAWGGAFDLGAVTQYIGAGTSLFLGIGLLLSEFGEFKANTPFLGTIFELLDIPNAMYQGSLTTEKRADRQYEVEFKDVSFRYPGTESWALRHVNMKFRVGERLAVVGPNGSGKTTFIKLLCRLYDPTEGEIRLNGIDIRKYRYDEYMGIFSVVFQDFKLLALPLGENVGAGQQYDRARAEECLVKAGFGNRLKELPLGLDTPLYKKLSEEGVEVSGGEAQKIAIARALYKDAPFIILDEPTAALDPLAEAEIYEKFNDIAGDKTAIYISHRLSSCKFCDEIAVFEHGAVVQKGTHESLLAVADGLYCRLWNAQAQYYEKEQG